jgi:hypothetical protein
LSRRAVSRSRVSTPACRLAAERRDTDHGTLAIRSWRAGPAVKYTYTTELSDAESDDADRWLVSGRLIGDFPGGIADLHWEFRLAGELISRLVIAP